MPGSCVTTRHFLLAARSLPGGRVGYDAYEYM